MRTDIFLRLTPVLLLWFSITAAAQNSRPLSYQGILTDTLNNPKPDGGYTLTFRLYPSASGGGPVWTETQLVQTARGLFTASLGSVTQFPASLDFSGNYWLGTQVGSEAELVPRFLLHAAAHSLSAARADTARVAGTVPDNSITSARILDGTIQRVDVAPSFKAPRADTADYAFVGTLSGSAGGDLTGTYPNPVIGSGVVSSAKLSDNSVTSAKIADGTILRVDVAPSFKAPRADTADYALMGAMSGAAGGDLAGTYPNPVINAGAVSTSKISELAVTSSKLADNSITSAKIIDGSIQRIDVAASFKAPRADTADHALVASGVAVPLSMSGSTTAPTYLLQANNSGSGHGVQGTSVNGFGVVGIASAPSGLTIGVVGNSSSPAGHAVSGNNLATTGNSIGVFGRTSSSEGVAIYGDGAGVTGNSGTGVLGIATGNGVYGRSTGVGLFSDGVRGETSSPAGAGVYGKGPNTGLLGESTSNTGTAYGVFGYATNPGGTRFAGYFSGNVHVTGNFSKASGAFKIDHPLDPANKYLYHSFVESPDMMNIYNGNVALDGNGEAWVVLPDWFDALNKDFRYQLTAIGAPSPNLFVAEEIRGNRFKIAGGAGGVKASWQVTGIRKDAYAEKHRIPVEELKNAEERGSYMHPEVFGMSKDRSIPSNRIPEIRAASERGK